jgi:nitroreductase
MPTDNECNKIIDQLIESRRSIRKFKFKAPPKELIKQVLHAGLLAPYSGIGVSREDFRRFIVIPRESKASTQVAAILKRMVESSRKQLEVEMKQDQFTKTHAGSFLQRLKLMGEHGIPNIGKAPYYIVVAEEKSILRVEQRSIAHCLQNMWLKATALGLEMQVLSITAQLDNDKEFCGLIKIPLDEYALDGCIVGYPDMNPRTPKRPNLNQVTEWIN